MRRAKKTKLDEEILATWERLYPGTFPLLITLPEEARGIYIQCRSDILIHNFSVEQAVKKGHQALLKYK